MVRRAYFKENRPRVVVAMSGGVDSSVAAALLLKRGYEVIGATMKLSSGGECFSRNERSCCSLKGVEDAQSVANTLGIPHYVFSLQKEFKDKVISYFCLEYSNAKTPNPCILCNQEIKFGIFLSKALRLGVAFIATGHYAKVDYNRRRHKYTLKESQDKSKDQSYALFSLSQSQLSRSILPLGDYTKVSVRSMARRLGLKVFDKPDSQEVCFIDDNNYRGFLREDMGLEIKPGAIVDKAGNILGRHEGIHFFTVGQRKGLGIAGGAPLYVLGIDKAKNRVIVGGVEDVKRDSLIAEELNWVSIDRPRKSRRLKAKIRSRHPKVWARVSPLPGGKVRVKFDQPQPAVTPGQAVVFYDKDVVVGGGWIR